MINMIKLLDINLTKHLWSKIYNEFKFSPSSDFNKKTFSFINSKCYKLTTVWSEEQECLVNEIFKHMSFDSIYALDWNHDCFEFNPYDYQQMSKQWFDKERNCNVYFPSYYPNGDYFFFVSKDFTYGLFGHPWRREIYVIGDALIKQFELNKEFLELS